MSGCSGAGLVVWMRVVSTVAAAVSALAALGAVIQAARAARDQRADAADQRADAAALRVERQQAAIQGWLERVEAAVVQLSEADHRRFEVVQDRLKLALDGLAPLYYVHRLTKCKELARTRNWDPDAVRRLAAEALVDVQQAVFDVLNNGPPTRGQVNVEALPPRPDDAVAEPPRGGVGGDEDALSVGVELRRLAVVDGCGRHQADAGVAMVVVPIEERPAERPGVGDRVKPGGEGWPVLERAKLRFGVGVVGRRVRPAVRLGDTEVGQQEGDGL